MDKISEQSARLEDDEEEDDNGAAHGGFASYYAWKQKRGQSQLLENSKQAEKNEVSNELLGSSSEN